MKRTLESDLPAAPSAASVDAPSGVVNPPPKERLLFVLAPTKLSAPRKTLKMRDEKSAYAHDYLRIFEYEVGSAAPALELERLLQEMVDAHPDTLTKVDSMVALPLVLLFASNCEDVCQLPKELTHLAPAKRQDWGAWGENITEDLGGLSYQQGPYKAVHFLTYDPDVLDFVIEKDELNVDPY
jgi:hypothetical protein